jgi:hypothetical protein
VCSDFFIEKFRAYAAAFSPVSFSRARLLIAPMTKTVKIVAAMPKTSSHTSSAVLNFNSESPAPTKTTAEERGSIPKNVPTRNDLSGTRAEAIKKFVSANGIAGERRSRKIIKVVRHSD